ncbi:MAG TPA: MerR family transcriptional regulator [Candidatus Hydrogenedentes bacterium]|nr:MerR family transcriptional regulator [Candidatus Hydrogenedentota bacterium]
MRVRIDPDTPKIDPKRNYRISEVSALVRVPVHVIRYWEKLIPELAPPRNAARKRCYKAKEIERILLVRQYIRSEGLSPEAARTKLVQVIEGGRPPQSRQEVIELLDQLAEEVRAAITVLDRVRQSDAT